MISARISSVPACESASLAYIDASQLDTSIASRAPKNARGSLRDRGALAW
jgi:hypothetical protein